MRWRHPPDSEAMRCSFCHKSQDSVTKLISSPNDYPQAYICDECVAVCARILEDDPGLSEPNAPEAESPESHPLANHSLTSELLTAIGHWLRQESLGAPAAEEFAEVRRIAIRLMRPGT